MGYRNAFTRENIPVLPLAVVGFAEGAYKYLVKAKVQELGHWAVCRVVPESLLSIDIEEFNQMISEQAFDYSNPTNEVVEG